MSENRNHNTVRLAKMGMLVAIAIVLVYFIHFPIFPAVAFLEYDPADIPILMGTFAFGPVAGILLTVVTAVIQGVTVSAASGLYGIIMHIISTSTLVIVAGVIYQKHKTRKTALIGDLGTGKTTLTKSIAAALGIQGHITSPTFNIVKEYKTGRVPLYHFDVYRITDPDEMYELGYEEYFYGDGVCVIEWADLIEELLPEHTIRIEIQYGENEGERIYRCTC